MLMKIDGRILTINKVICRHIDTLNNSSRGIVSQDILQQLRHFVEHIMLKFYAQEQEKDIDDNYKNIELAIKYAKSRADLKVLIRFHNYLQISVSHYTLDEENSERLMLKYYEYLLKIKNLLQEKFSLHVLNNLENFPLNMDSNLREYYEKIADKINKFNKHPVRKMDKFYIKKIKPFFSNQRIYYEVTFTKASDYTSKFNRFIAFTSLEITKNYAVKF